jgi:UDPglucose 6-dehydrogenase
VEAAVDVNTAQKTRLYEKACKRMITFQGLKIAILGLAFKPGTDDLREAPSIDNVERLLEDGANLYAFDPVAEENFKKRYPEGGISKGSIQYVSAPEKALENADICFIFTEWKEIKELKPALFKEAMRIPLVYDGRNVYNVQAMKDAGVEYYSIGR